MGWAAIFLSISTSWQAQYLAQASNCFCFGFIVIFLINLCFLDIMAAGKVNKYTQEKYFDQLVPNDHGKYLSSIST